MWNAMIPRFYGVVPYNSTPPIFPIFLYLLTE